MTYFNDNQLPEPYEKDILEEKFRKMQLKDQTTRKEIIEHNLRLVVYTAKKFSNTNYETEELISIGTIGLTKAVDTFNLDKKINFATYASRCIENEILMFLRSNKKHGNNISLSTPIARNENNQEVLVEDILEDIHQDFVSEYENQEIYKEIREFVEGLPERERYITKMLFHFNNDNFKTQKELEEELGISQSHISRIRKKVVNELSIHLQKIENIDPPKMKVLSSKNSKVTED